MAIIEFELDGTIITANENFCAALGYTLDEIKGKHHSIFVEPEVVGSDSYRGFWHKLGTGAFDSGRYKRICKDGKEIWIEASYNPVFHDGTPYKVVKFATDITASVKKAAETEGKMTALSRSQAIIEFEIDGTIITANENFLATLGYRLEEIEGKHHSIFCEPSYVASGEYRDFWPNLASGHFSSGEFKRYGRGGTEIWIQATYNPIFDADGRVFKVVKFASDITERVKTNQFIADAMVQVSENARSIDAAAGEVRQASDELAHRSERQAASVEQTAAALEQLTTTISDSAMRAKEAGQLANRTRDTAEKAGSIVNDAVEAMGRIENSAAEISKIIGVIDQIAFQTNLLALNAGVEAARAGEAGKGFAVVAQEVRELSQRSATAAKEIKELIANSDRHVETGVGLVGKTGETLTSIVQQIMEVATNVDAIVRASQEQSSGLSEINEAVNVIDQGTQQSAAMCEESTAAAHTLAREAADLFGLIEQFEKTQAAKKNASDAVQKAA
ncbi:PAS domain S-box protein [Pseudohoeflea suaedae]|uniref:PAS domain S-box protein n=1 Tax=Pseudohoeflea suaedae TaxID=877384 RepID=A0A4R5PRH9_9HYPH|nr:PAS domain-containing methyl-accepting chemotaxis protein [Pseudohoeflea suaedae]TDH39473.1 PAS domain S-box protein [Pseudohoeflea suaedae]